MNTLVKKIKQKNKTYSIYGFNLIDIFIYVFLGILAITTVYPFIYVISNSVSEPFEVAANKVWFFPKGFSVAAYKRIMSLKIIYRSFFNSIFFTATITFLNVFNSMLAGFALTKRGLVVRKYIVIYIMIPMFFHAGLIPTYITIGNYNLFNTIWVIILPSIVGIWNIILARTYINNLPDGLREAAKLDGANDFQLLTRIIVPISKPIIAVLSLYTALGAWNSWFNYMLYLPTRPELHPLQFFLTKVLLWGEMQATLHEGEGIDSELLLQKMKLAAVMEQFKYVIIVVATLPIMSVYPFLQKFFIKGTLLGSLKE
jgi:putative aldouronate transport system permease protein